MKKILFTIFVLAGLVQFTQAQEVGIRFGDAFGGHFAIDGVFGLGSFSRIHADVSFGDDGVGVDALWDFIHQPLGSGFDWYLGVGPSAYLGDPFALGVSGEIGIEYHFDIPLAIGADWRPTFIIIEDTDFEAGWFGLNIRYVFGK
ncbi:MAG: outer membrane insertion C- signal [bacterium]|nr:outer membrane insertion C- signal [bacterium]